MVIPSDLDGLHCGSLMFFGPSGVMIVIPSDLDGLHCGEGGIGNWAPITNVIPSDLDGLHCGATHACSIGVRTAPSSRPIWTGSIAARSAGGSAAGTRLSSRPIWTGSIAAAASRFRPAASATVIPSDLDGLHCGWLDDLGASDTALVIPSDLDGLHCGISVAMSRSYSASGHPVRSGRAPLRHRGLQGGPGLGGVIPSDLDGLHCGIFRVGTATEAIDGHPVRSGRAPLRQLLARRALDCLVRSSRPIWTGSIAAYLATE